MEIIYVNNDTQNENTENPQLINGEIYYWKTQNILFRSKSLKEEIERRNWHNAKYILIYDTKAIHYHFCDQGCTPGMGCKQNYSETDHALTVSMFIVVEDNKPKMGYRHKMI